MDTTSSQTTPFIIPGHYGYRGSKALMNMMMKGLSLELAKVDGNNRAALALNPGWMKVRLHRFQMQLHFV